MQQDKILIETTKTHRARLSSALSYGSLGRRRSVNSNLKRLIGSVILAAVAGVACLGTSFVLGYLQGQREDQALEAYQSALQSNPIPESDEMVADEETGFLIEQATGNLVDPRTGFIVDPETMLATDAAGNTVDPRLGWIYHPDTGYYEDPSNGVLIDPETRQVVRDDS